MSGSVATRLKRGVSVPMDADAIHPVSIIAAVTMGVKTLDQRAEANGHVLDWNTIEIALQPPGIESDAALLVVRAARTS